MKNPPRLSILVLLAFRLMLLLSNPFSGVVGFGDLGNFFRLTEIPGWPYFHFWSEYPPIFPFLSKVIYLLAGGRENTYVNLLFLLLTLFDALNLYLFSKLCEQIKPGDDHWLPIGMYLFVMIALPYSWWYFEPLVITTFLAGLLWILQEKPLRVGCVVGAGILVKVFPALLLPLAVKKMGWKRGGLAVGVALGLVAVVFGGLWLVSPEFTRASLISQGMKGSWETVWAVLDGNLKTGAMGPLVARLDPSNASLTTRNPAVISPFFTLLVFGGLGLLVFLRSRLTNAIRSAAFGLVTMGLFFLWSPGWSVQWSLYFLPWMILVFPARVSVMLGFSLMIANLLEWPVIYQVNESYVSLTIMVRTLLMVLITWMAYQVLSGREVGGLSYSSGRRSEKTDK